MSASTVPAAAPEPGNTTATTPTADAPTTPAPGLLASMLAPVAPARSAAFTLAQDPADGTPGTGAVLPSEGLSSADYNGDEDGQQDTNSTGKGTKSGQQPQGIFRAWMLAGAARWARGGGTQNKRLDMKKARAQAHQVKESRTVNSGPAGSLGAGGGRGSNGSSSGGGKSLNSKTPKSNGTGGASKGPKNSTGPSSSGGGAGRGPSSRDTNRSTDRSNTGPKAGSGGSAGGRGTSGNGSTGPKGDTSSSTPKPSKDTKATTTSGGKGGTQGPSGAPGKAGASGATGKGEKAAKPTDSPKDSKAQAGKDSTDTSKTTPAKPTPDGASTTHGPAGDKRPKLSLLKRKKTTAPKAPADDKQPTTPDKAKTTTDDKTKTSTPKDPTPAAPGTDGKPFTTRPSRETGYRDGTRAAHLHAHVQAYKDGVRDGWTDTTEAAQREKARLDQAHTDRKAARQETPVTLATSTDHHENTDPTTPIGVVNVTPTHVLLGEGSSRASMTRGEVRNLKDMERRLEAQANILDTRAEQTRNLKAHADEQAHQATRLLEATRGAKGGDKLVGTLTRLQEAAQAQAATAEEIYKRSVRGAERCRTTLSNVQARYGGIYQAVIDSPEHAPGELGFYQG